MARTLDKSRPFVEVFGDVDENEVDKDGNKHVAHRYRQFGMMFDGEGNLIGEEKDVPPEQEDEDQMRARIERELRIKIEQEYRDKAAKAAKAGGGDETDTANAGSKKNAVGTSSDDLPGGLGKSNAGAKKK